MTLLSDLTTDYWLLATGDHMKTYAQHIPSLLALSKKAGDAILKVYESATPDIQHKKDDSPLTQADLASHQIIVEGLAALTPNIPILSEEDSDIPYEVRSTWRSYWLIDPLDGTKEFINRNGEFTVNIALIEDKEPVIGVVYIPVKDEYYFACKGAGAFYQTGSVTELTAEQSAASSVVSTASDAQPSKPPHGHPIPITVAESQAGPLSVVVSRSHAGPETQEYLRKLEAKGFTIDALSIGSSLKLCYVAHGIAHVYPRFGPTMEWDIAAAQCVVEEAGGFVLDLEQRRLSYNKPDLHSPYFIAACNDWLCNID
jgi:3'(2'), 5'-bisphosphate nucleotidase